MTTHLRESPEGARSLEVVRSYLYDLSSVRPEDVLRFGGKATNLGALIAAGLVVPPGMAASAEAYERFLETGEVPVSLIREIQAARRRLGGKIAIRSSATTEDGADLSMAGVFETHYVTKDEEVETAVRAIYEQARSSEVREYLGLHGIDQSEVKMGLVIQELINPEFAGVIYADPARGTLLIQYVEGFGARLVDGHTHGSAVRVDMHTGRIIDSIGYDEQPLPKGFIQEVQRQTEVIMRTFPYDTHDIEFAYREGTVYILQARALTVDLGEPTLKETPDEALATTKERLRAIAQKEKNELGTRSAVFIDSNFSELLPRPAAMDFGIFRHIFTGHNGLPGAIQLGRQAMGYPLGKESIGLLHLIGGRAYASVARDAATFYAGFPDKPQEYFEVLVNEYLTAIIKDPQKGSYPEMGLYLQDPTLEDLEKRFGKTKAKKYFATYRRFLKRMQREAERFKEDFKKTQEAELKAFIAEQSRVDLNELSTEQLLTHTRGLLEHLRTVSCVAFVKAARLGFYYSQRMLGSLRSQFGFSDREAQEMFAKLSQGLEGSLITEMNMAIATAASMEEALRIAQRSVGHFSTQEMLEIRHPRLQDDPAALRAYVEGIRAGNYVESFEEQMVERKQVEAELLARLPEGDRAGFAEMIGSAQIYMAMRESIKYYFTQEYSLLKDALEELEDRLSLSEGDIYFVYPEELTALAEDPQSMQHLINARKQSFENVAEIDMPAVITEDGIETLALRNETNGEFTEMRGKFLAEGPVPLIRGTVVNVDEFKTLEESLKHIRSYKAAGGEVILVATQLTLAHDPLINLADALIVQNAGLVSHAAQRARELGKAAMGGIQSRKLKTGMMVELDMKELVVRKI